MREGGSEGGSEGGREGVREGGRGEGGRGGREREKLHGVTGKKGSVFSISCGYFSLPLASSDTIDSQGVNQGVCLCSPEFC